MPKTLLAVDDSATMRKVLEITFAGEDFRVVSADSAANALTRLSEDPVAVVIDITLGADDGYALAKEVRARSARTAIVMMASRFSPYDGARGREAGADDAIDKPFDTQALIDKVKKALAAREGARALPAASPAQSGTSLGMPPRPGVPAPGAPRPAAPMRATLSFEGGMLPGLSPPAAAPPAPPSPPAALPRSTPFARSVAPAPVPPAAQTLAPPAGPADAARPEASIPRAAVGAINGQMQGKLSELGLTAEQVNAVLALSREVVERVVWEVVPQLAEAIIKEEIARLTKES